MEEEALSTLDFINYLNLMLPLVEPINEEDKPAIQRFAKIGIAPGVSFDKSVYSEELLKAMEEGIATARKKIQLKA